MKKGDTSEKEPSKEYQQIVKIFTPKHIIIQQPHKSVCNGGTFV